MEGVVQRTCFRIPWVLSVCPVNDHNITQHVRSWEGLPRLEMITTKCRNQLQIDNVETLFVLANLQIPVKSPLQYENEVAYLEENR